MLFVYFSGLVPGTFENVIRSWSQHSKTDVSSQGQGDCIEGQNIRNKTRQHHEMVLLPTKFFNSILLIWHNFRPVLSANESLSQAAQHKVKTARHSQTYAYHKLTCVDFFFGTKPFFSWIPHDAGRLSNNLVVKLWFHLFLAKVSHVCVVLLNWVVEV